MKQNNRQTLPLGRSTKAEYAGLSLLHPQLFTVVDDTYKYYNEIVKNVSDFLGRLMFKKFSTFKTMIDFSRRQLWIVNGSFRDYKSSHFTWFGNVVAKSPMYIFA